MHLAMVEAATYHADASSGLVQNEQAAEFLKPERVSPMVTVLTHPTCPVTGEILCSWGGWYGRFGVTLNRGWASRTGAATAEDLVANWGARGRRGLRPRRRTRLLRGRDAGRREELLRS